MTELSPSLEPKEGFPTKKVVSVSIGSSKRDHEANVHLLGYNFNIRRIGTDGDMTKAKELLKELDGQVDAIGLGGLDIYLCSSTTKYALRDGMKFLELVKKTPVVDGSGLKNTLERESIRFLEKDGRIPLKDRKILMVCAMDRFGMAEAFEEAKGNVVYGDMMFALGVDKPLTSAAELAEHAERLLPDLCKMPISFIYPTGKKQSQFEPNDLTTPYYNEAEIIAGDFHFIRRHMPEEMKGKTIITNTVTKDDEEEMRKRGVSWLITTTPELYGRSFGTNVMEAVFIAILGKKWDDVVPQDYLDLIKRLELKPRMVQLDI